MKKVFIHLGRGLALAFCLFLPLLCSAEQFVKLTAEIDVGNWNWWFFCDKNGSYPGSDNGTVPSIFTTNTLVHCVVGTNTWFVECVAEKYKVSYWFTGTNIIEQSTGPNRLPFTGVSPSIDGNPGRPVRVADRMVFNVTGRICWLAFCSGSYLKREGRKIYPPSDFWKESRLVRTGWSDRTKVFEDKLGLPKSMTLFSTNSQTVVQYQTRQPTNVLGWNFPLEFYMVQYKPADTNAWEIELTAKGRVTSIEAGAMPPIPKETLNPDWIDK